MGTQDVREEVSPAEVRSFTQAILEEVRALEALVERGMIEDGIQRMGAEQEMFLVGSDSRPMPVADEILDSLTGQGFTSELARFNLEANLLPKPLSGDCLRRLEAELEQAVATADAAAGKVGARVMLTGILPTLNHDDLVLDNLTPRARYRQLNDNMARLRGGTFGIQIDGIDNLETAFDSVMAESANTSLQLHLQVGADEFAHRYNLAQLITAPLLAAATNSPLLLARRLWHETRIALFERAIDVRSVAQQERGHLTRVSFGDRWVEHSALELFRENVERFHVLMTGETDSDPMAAVEAGTPPRLPALMLHNTTVYRWNRPCYGVADGVAHFRIENRILPAGPTIVDQTANAALFYGLMQGLHEPYGDISKRLSFGDAKANFLAAAEHGLASGFTWLDGRTVGARDLLLHDLIPAAREGLAQLDCPQADIDRYLGVIEERVRSGQTGSRWLLDAYEATDSGDMNPEARCAAVTDAMLERQASGVPVHDWAPLRTGVRAPASTPARTVRDIMTEDVFTVLPEDVLDLATSIMEWRHIRHVPVEDSDGRLVGLLSAAALLQAHQRGHEATEESESAIAVSEVMDSEPPTVAPSTDLDTAAAKLLEAESGYLLVVDRDRLVGIVTERDFVRAAFEREA